MSSCAGMRRRSTGRFARCLMFASRRMCRRWIWPRNLSSDMVPQTQKRKARNSSRVNLLISFAFHALIVIVGFYFAARGGLLGNQLKKIAVEMVKEKPPEKPKEPEKPKVEPPKVETPKELPKVEAPKVAEAPKVETPTITAPPAVAPPAAELPSFNFEGGKAVETASSPIDVYRGLVQ